MVNPFSLEGSRTLIREALKKAGWRPRSAEGEATLPAAATVLPDSEAMPPTDPKPEEILKEKGLTEEKRIFWRVLFILSKGREGFTLKKSLDPVELDEKPILRGEEKEEVQGVIKGIASNQLISIQAINREGISPGNKVDPKAEMRVEFGLDGKNIATVQLSRDGADYSIILIKPLLKDQKDVDKVLDNIYNLFDYSDQEFFKFSAQPTEDKK